MEENETDEYGSVRGLLDSQRVAEILGIERITLRSWIRRKAQGAPGVHMQFPDPLPEQLGGTALWDVEEIRAFKEKFGDSTLARKRTKRKDASDVLRAVQSKHD